MELSKSEDDIILVIKKDSSSSLICRICHEEEEDDENSTTSMESPCACSGTLKYAHRGCIQRWCDEKGSIVCEICLQKFEPGYTAPTKLASLDTRVIIRESLEVPRQAYESRLAEDESEQNYPQCSSPCYTSSSRFRSVTLIFMLVLLIKHLFIIVSTGEEHYPFTLTTVLLLRASGIILPFYFIMRTVTAIQHMQRRYQHRHRRDASPVQRPEGDRHLQHTIQIHS